MISNKAIFNVVSVSIFIYKMSAVEIFNFDNHLDD